jgi:hypothetical protein
MDQDDRFAHADIVNGDTDIADLNSPRTDRHRNCDIV